MARDAKKMRDELFETLFQEEGITLSDLMYQLKLYINAWDGLYNLFDRYVPGFDIYEHIDNIKMVGDKYLIIKQRYCRSYLIIDVTTKKVLKKKDVAEIFNEQFFMDNFKDESTELGNKYLEFYYFLQFKGDVQKLIDLYYDNQKIFGGPKEIFYKNDIGDAYVYFNLDLTNGNIQIGFRTPDQFLYEHLHINQDLTPFGMQDATSKIGIDKMKEMFARIKDIKVPIKHIPEEILKIIGVKKHLSSQSESKEKQISLTKI